MKCVDGFDLWPGGVLHDGLLTGQSAQSVRAVLAPKAGGAHALLAACAAAPLRAWNAFSSVASFIGSAGQGNYAAANAVLDALAGSLQGQGLPGGCSLFSTAILSTACTA